MLSPDVTPYVDLTIFDRDPQDLVEVAIVDAVIKLPDWEPAEGHTEMVVLESDALIVAELIYAINRLPGAIMEIVLKLYGQDRDPGSPPTVQLRFELSDDLGHVIPAGTTVRLELGSDVEPMDFTTDVEAVIPLGVAQGVVMATGDRNSIDANGTGAETELELVDGIPYVDRVMTNAAVGAGTDPESGEEFLTRAGQLLQTLVTTLVLPKHFTSRALAQPYVFRATTLDNYDPATGPNPGDNAGHVTVAVLGQGGAPVSGPDKGTLDALLEEMALANLSVHVIDAVIVAQAVEVTVVRTAGFTDVQVTDAVTARLEAYLDPDAWEWGRDIFRNELISEVDQVAGVDRVVDIVVPAADVALGVNELADAGIVTVNVQAP